MRYPAYILKKSTRFLRDKPYDVKMQVKFVISINDANPWPEIIVILFTLRLPYAQRTVHFVSFEW